MNIINFKKEKWNYNKWAEGIICTNEKMHKRNEYAQICYVYKEKY